MHKPPDGGLLAAGLEQEPGPLDVRLPVFIRRNARNQQPAGKVIDDLHAIEGGLQSDSICDVAYNRLGTLVRQGLCFQSRPRQYADGQAVTKQPLHQA